MLSLISIRAKYLYRHPCLLFWSYMFQPMIIFLLSMGLLKIRIVIPPTLQPKVEPTISGQNYFFSEENNNTLIQRNYDLLKTYLPNITIITNNESYCKDIINFVQEETNYTINCSFYTKNFTNDTSHIIKIDNKEGKYKISLIERQREFESKLMFYNSDLDQDTMTDLFYVVNETRNESIF